MNETDTQAAPLQVRVRELEWAETVGAVKDRPAYRARTIVGDYEVRSALPGVFGNFWRAPSGHQFEEETIDLCFEAAQADYERRILSALDLSTPPQIAALEAEIEKLRGEIAETVRQSDAVCDSYAKENGQLHERAERAEADVARLTEALKPLEGEADVLESRARAFHLHDTEGTRLLLNRTAEIIRRAYAALSTLKESTNAA